MKFHVNTHGDDQAGFKTALVKAIELAIVSGTGELLIRIGLLGNTSGIMSDVLGNQFVNSLVKSKKKSLNIDGHTIDVFLESDKSGKSSFRTGSILALWATAESLDTVLKDRRGTNLVYVPWLEEERDEYLRANPDSEEVTEA